MTHVRQVIKDVDSLSKVEKVYIEVYCRVINNLLSPEIILGFKKKSEIDAAIDISHRVAHDSMRKFIETFEPRECELTQRFTEVHNEITALKKKLDEMSQKDIDI